MIFMGILGGGGKSHPNFYQIRVGTTDLDGCFYGLFYRLYHGKSPFFTTTWIHLKEYVFPKNHGGPCEKEGFGYV